MAGAALILVRHGRPAIDPDTAPTTWPLSPDGREAVARLAERIAEFAPTGLVASPEPKALQTAEILAARLGFADTSHLAHVFQRITGRAPSTYRRSPR